MAPNLPTLQSAYPRAQASASQDLTSSHVSDEEEEGGEEVPEVSSDDLNWADRETVSYVVGAFVRRLDCQSCRDTMLVDEANSSSHFTSLMTYASATMFYPKEDVIDHFFSRLKPIFSHFEKRFFEPNIVKLTVLKFRFPSAFPACSQLHANTLLEYFSRAILRTFCKEKNEKLKERHTAMKRKFKKLNV